MKKCVNGLKVVASIELQSNC